MIIYFFSLIIYLVSFSSIGTKTALAFILIAWPKICYMKPLINSVTWSCHFSSMDLNFFALKNDSVFPHMGLVCGMTIGGTLLEEVIERMGPLVDPRAGPGQSEAPYPSLPLECVRCPLFLH